ncbi:MAG: DNA adenine methylase [Acidobacteria bacterium]|nr:MAG: DNA adenine methylase [Acidobacteriota bacterium]
MEIRDFQLKLFGSLDAKRAVNVASVNQYSPFRYPGGKTWLVPFVIQWLISQQKRPADFIEPFAGGAIIGLTVAIERLAQHVTLVEIDEQVAAVWKAIIYGDYHRLVERIANFELTQENIDFVLSSTYTSVEEKAFQTILRNRVNRGGILAPGAGKIKNGENGKGLKSRWYPQTLCRRILKIGEVRERITFIEGDGLQILEQNAKRPDVVYFIDPPYTVAGKKAGTRLYTHFEIDHEKLFAIAETLYGEFLMTYDNVAAVKEMAERHGFVTEAVSMKNAHNREMTELLISRSIAWLRG